MNKLRVLGISGSPYELGYQHGKAFAREIGELTEERLRLSCDPFWTGGQTATLDEVLALGRACLAYHQEFDAALMEEMQGMADATGLGVNELVIMNGFTDFVDIVANPAVLHHRRSAPAADVDFAENFDDGGCTGDQPLAAGRDRRCGPRSWAGARPAARADGGDGRGLCRRATGRAADSLRRAAACAD